VFRWASCPLDPPYGIDHGASRVGDSTERSTAGSRPRSGPAPEGGPKERGSGVDPGAMRSRQIGGSPGGSRIGIGRAATRAGWPRGAAAGGWDWNREDPRSRAGRICSPPTGWNRIGSDIGGGSVPRSDRVGTSRPPLVSCASVTRSIVDWDRDRSVTRRRSREIMHESGPEDPFGLLNTERTECTETDRGDGPDRASGRSVPFRGFRAFRVQ
jgi:hypothetical protein